MCSKTIDLVLSLARKDLITNKQTERDRRMIEWGLDEYMVQMVKDDIYTSYESLEDLGITGDSVVLDVGCGPGATGVVICDHVRPKAIFGVDVERTLLTLGKYINRHYLDPQNRIFYIQSTVYNIPLKSNSCTHAICRLVLTYVHNEQTVSEMARILQRGGKVYIRVREFREFTSELFKERRMFSLLRNAFAIVNGTIMHFTGRQLSVRRGVTLFSDCFQTRKGIRKLLSKYGIEATFIPTPEYTTGILIIGTKT